MPFLENVIEIDVRAAIGYNQLTLDNGSHFTFYAHDKSSWPAKRQAELFYINELAAATSVDTDQTQQFELKTISLFWWYALSLLGFCGLWLDERLFD